ncbi:integrin alpha-2 [Erethizon dorsatum]
MRQRNGCTAVWTPHPPPHSKAKSHRGAGQGLRFSGGLRQRPCWRSPVAPLARCPHPRRLQDAWAGRSGGSQVLLRVRCSEGAAAGCRAGLRRAWQANLIFFLGGRGGPSAAGAASNFSQLSVGRVGALPTASGVCGLSSLSAQRRSVWVSPALAVPRRRGTCVGPGGVREGSAGPGAGSRMSPGSTWTRAPSHAELLGETPARAHTHTHTHKHTHALSLGTSSPHRAVLFYQAPSGVAPKLQRRSCGRLGFRDVRRRLGGRSRAPSPAAQLPLAQTGAARASSAERQPEGPQRDAWWLCERLRNAYFSTQEYEEHPHFLLQEAALLSFHSTQKKQAPLKSLAEGDSSFPSAFLLLLAATKRVQTHSSTCSRLHYIKGTLSLVNLLFHSKQPANLLFVPQEQSLFPKVAYCKHDLRNGLQRRRNTSVMVKCGVPFKDPCTEGLIPSAAVFRGGAWRSFLNCYLAYNVGLSEAKIFSGPSSEQFGYSVQQFINPKGNWILVGSPWSGFPENRMGDVYKCPVDLSTATCEKLNLQTSTSIQNVTEVKTNMSLGLTLTRNMGTGGFLTCGPLWAQQCGSQYYTTGVCCDISPDFQHLASFAPAIQTCPSFVDVVVVCDESNSIYPWDAVKNFLEKFVQGLDIGPRKTQVALIQYANDPRVVYNLNTFKTKDEMIRATSQTFQSGGDLTNTFKAIQFARTFAYSAASGGRPGATKVMVVVTDGESHDGSMLKSVIEQCNNDNILRFGIAVLGYLNRNALDTKNLIKEIKAIASIPTERFFFNVADEAALLEKAGTLGERIFSIEGTVQGGENIQLEMSQVGFSADYSPQNDSLMLGAVGAFDWSGTIVQETSHGHSIFPKEAFDQILQDRNHSSYLGYSVAAISTEKSVYFVAGAPRANYTGQIILYSLDEHGNITIIQTHRGDQVGSYFGSVLCSVDVDKDTITDVLLVGAPTFMNDLKKEEGKVYLFTIAKGILNQHQFLEGPEGTENARFGSAIAALSDINMDGYNDVIVGSPLENHNSGAVYIYNGDQGTIRTKYSQKILGSDRAFKSQLQFFGRSLDGYGDLNGDSITDVSIGAFGQVVQLWSQSIADVSVEASFSPEKIILFNKNAQIVLQLCFRAKFRPTRQNDQVAIMYDITLDADGYSSRVTSRGLFQENNERCLQKNMVLNVENRCTQYTIQIQKPSDVVNSLDLRVDIRLENPGTSPALEAYSDTVKVFSVPFYKDCGGDGICISDLVLDVQQLPATQKQSFIVGNQNKRLTFSVTLKNKGENAYNTAIVANFSENLFFASSSMPVDGTEVTCQVDSSQKPVTCDVGYPALKSEQQVTFTINFDFNLQNLQNQASFSFQAFSESEEANKADNSVNLKIPLLYDAEIHLTRSTNINFYEVSSDENVPSIVRNFEDIGPKFIFSLKVTTGLIPVSMASVIIHIPQYTKEKNPLLYLTDIHMDQAGDISCKAEINPLKLGQTPSSVSFKSENFRHIKELDCRTASCSNVICWFKNLDIKGEYFINVSTRIWNRTFAASTFQTVQLTATAEINTYNPQIYVIEENTVTIPLMIMKPNEKAEVPTGVIVGSIIAGILLLLALVSVLWKLGFFKRKYEKMMKNPDEMDETTELHS